MNRSAENYLKAIRFERPEWVPSSVSLLPASWIKYREDLEEVVLSHPRVFPGFRKGQVDFDFHDGFSLPTYDLGRRTDCWGVVWENIRRGCDSIPVEEPLFLPDSHLVKAREQVSGQRRHGRDADDEHDEERGHGRPANRPALKPDQTARGSSLDWLTVSPPAQVRRERLGGLVAAVDRLVESGLQHHAKVLRYPGIPASRVDRLGGEDLLVELISRGRRERDRSAIAHPGESIPAGCGGYRGSCGLTALRKRQRNNVDQSTGRTLKTRNSKFEIRNSKQASMIQIPMNQTVPRFRHWDLRCVSYFVLGISNVD